MNALNVHHEAFFNEQQLGVSCYAGKSPREAAFVGFLGSRFMPATSDEEKYKKKEKEKPKQSNKCCLSLDLVRLP